MWTWKLWTWTWSRTWRFCQQVLFSSPLYLCSGGYRIQEHHFDITRMGSAIWTLWNSRTIFRGNQHRTRWPSRYLHCIHICSNGRDMPSTVNLLLKLFCPPSCTDFRVLSRLGCLVRRSNLCSMFAEPGRTHDRASSCWSWPIHFINT